MSPAANTRKSEPTISAQAAVCSYIGKRNLRNDDNFYLDGHYRSSFQPGPDLLQIEAAPYSVFAVFDGVGGSSQGDIASVLAATSLRGQSQELAFTEQVDFVKNRIRATHDFISKEARRLDSRFATTAVLAIRQDNRVTIYNVGDSRAYLFWNKEIFQLSHDDTAAQKFIDLGLAEPGEGSALWGNRLTQYLGGEAREDTIEPHMCQVTFQPGVKILLCSDGLSSVVTEAQMRKVLSEPLPAGHLVQGLVSLAVLQNSKDNITALLLAAEGEE